jgi:hypothetical protein
VIPVIKATRSVMSWLPQLNSTCPAHQHAGDAGQGLVSVIQFSGHVPPLALALVSQQDDTVNVRLNDVTANYATQKRHAAYTHLDRAGVYKQTVIGAAWTLIRPFLAMVVFTVVFGGREARRIRRWPCGIHENQPPQMP